MRSSFSNLRPETDADLSKLHAKLIAQAFGSKPKRESNIIIGEEPYDYRVPCHLPDYWCKALVSETTIMFESNHKKGAGAVTPFFYTFSPWKNMATDTVVEEAVALIGVPVFRQHWVGSEPILESLRDKNIQPLLANIVKQGVKFMACASSQLLAEFDSADAAVSVRRVNEFRDLQTVLSKYNKPYPR